MSGADIPTELSRVVAQLSCEQQQLVLEFANGLTTTPPEKRPVRHILDLAGCMTPEEAEEMTRAIDEGKTV